MKDEVYRVNFSMYPKVLIAQRFKKIQELAFDKNIPWFSTGKHFEPCNRLIGNDNRLIVSIYNNEVGIRCYLAYGGLRESTYIDISYRNMVIKLRALK